MISQIWKFHIADYQPGGIEMPENTHVIDAHMQNGKMFIWGIVPDVNAPKIKRNFDIVGTGWDLLCKEWRFIATVHEPPHVWHVFEVIRK